jgi:hypothetical protein
VFIAGFCGIVAAAPPNTSANIPQRQLLLLRLLLDHRLHAEAEGIELDEPGGVVLILDALVCKDSPFRRTANLQTGDLEGFKKRRRLSALTAPDGRRSMRFKQPICSKEHVYAQPTKHKQSNHPT